MSLITAVFSDIVMAKSESPHLNIRRILHSDPGNWTWIRKRCSTIVQRAELSFKSYLVYFCKTRAHGLLFTSQGNPLFPLSDVFRFNSSATGEYEWTLAKSDCLSRQSIKQIGLLRQISLKLDISLVCFSSSWTKSSSLAFIYLLLYVLYVALLSWLWATSFGSAFLRMLSSFVP